MSICLRTVIPSRGCGRKVWKLQCPQPPLDKASSFRLPTPEIQGGPGSGERTRVESASRRRARMRCGPCVPALPSAVAPAPAPALRCCRAQAGRRRWLHTHVPGRARPQSAAAPRLAPAGSPQRPTLSALSASLASPPQLPRPGAASANRAAQHACGGRPEASPPRWGRRSPGSVRGGGSVTAPRRFDRRPPLPERCTGGRSRGSSTLLETLLQLAFGVVPPLTGRPALPCRILSGLCL